MEFPGSIYMSQSYKFLRPVYIDDEVVASVTITEIFEEKERLNILTEVKDSNDKVCIQGEALIKLPGLKNLI